MADVKACGIAVVALLAFTSLSGGPSLAAGKAKKQQKPAPQILQAVPFEATPGYAVKPSDVIMPDGVPVGQYRRIIRPFPNWTLICDENLSKKQRICNVTQTITRTDRSEAFSWSLAAAQNGQPFMILRTPTTIDASHPVTLDISDGGEAVTVPVKGCNANVCIGYLQVGPRLRAAINKGRVVQVSFRNASNGNSGPVTSFRAPLQGLSDALSGV